MNQPEPVGRRDFGLLDPQVDEEQEVFAVGAVVLGPRGLQQPRGPSKHRVVNNIGLHDPLEPLDLAAVLEAVLESDAARTRGE